MCMRQFARWCSGVIVVAGICAITARANTQDKTSQPSTQGVAEEVSLKDARFACAMETHPDESDLNKRGAYIAMEPGDCPWCGMTLKPADELAWINARKAAQGGEVAYTCPEHQHVFSKTGDKCPRCDRELSPFKVMYTCPNPQHASVVRAGPGVCPHDRRKLTPFRGIWLSSNMADRNVPPNPEVARQAEYHCPLHPLVHSDRPGNCTICARELASTVEIESARTEKQAQKTIPAGAKYVCPMVACWHFAPESGRCPECGMQTKPIDDVSWAGVLPKGAPRAGPTDYVCPMHADRVQRPEPGACPVCGMQLVKADAIGRPASRPAAIAAQMNYLMEHYLALQRRFSSDRSDDVALHGLGLVGVADEIIKHLEQPNDDLLKRVLEAARTLRGAALKLTGKSLDDDRVTFVALSGAMRKLVEHVRPGKQQYPKIYIFHCPMTKGDWLQTSDDMANPFYGFKMLKCGELQATK